MDKEPFWRPASPPDASKIWRRLLAENLTTLRSWWLDQDEECLEWCLHQLLELAKLMDSCGYSRLSEHLFLRTFRLSKPFLEYHLLVGKHWARKWKGEKKFSEAHHLLQYLLESARPDSGKGGERRLKFYAELKMEEGILLEGLGSLQRALSVFDEVYGIYRHHSFSDYNHCAVLFNLGSVLFDLGRQDRCRDFLDKSLEVNQGKHLALRANAQLQWANYCEFKEDLEGAVQRYWYACEDYSRQQNLSQQVKILLRIAWLYLQLGQEENAHRALEQAHFHCDRAAWGEANAKALIYKAQTLWSAGAYEKAYQELYLLLKKLPFAGEWMARAKWLLYSYHWHQGEIVWIKDLGQDPSLTNERALLRSLPQELVLMNEGALGTGWSEPHLHKEGQWWQKKQQIYHLEGLSPKLDAKEWRRRFSDEQFLRGESPWHERAPFVK